MTRRYTKEIHQQAVSRYFKGKQTAAQISRVMNIPHQTVGAWITAAKSGIADVRWTPRRMVGAAGFEPTTTCAQGRCATRLRYAPSKSA